MKLSLTINCKTTLLLLLLTSISVTGVSASETYEAFASEATMPGTPLPSDQALGDMQNQPTPSTRDWWEEGPPEGGDGGGSFVGAPISKSKAAVPVTVASLLYLFICLNKKKKK